MLKSIGLSYWHYTILMAAELLAAFISLYVWGKFNDEKGSKHVLLITGILIPLWPVLFILNNNFTYLILIQALSGILWSGFNLAASNFIYDAAEPEKRTRYVAYFNLLTGTGVFLGAITGGLLMSIISIKTVFLVSGAARLGVTLFLLPSIKEMRLIELNIGRSVFSNSVFIKPQNMSFEVIPQQPKPKLPPPKPVKRKPKPVVLAPQEKTILQKKFIENMLENGKK
jgi:MFS family permease